MVTRVIFIVGMERSGSTLVHNIIGQYNDIDAFGEVKYIYKNFNKKICGCGALLKECSLWEKIITDEPSHYYREKEPSITKSRYFLLYLNKRVRKYLIKRNSHYIKHVKDTYQKLANTGNALYVMDSSKNLVQPLLLIDDPEFDIRVIHVTRDPRGVEYSLYKRKLSGHKDNINHSPLFFCLKWCLSNKICKVYEKILKRKYIFIRYEDVMKNADIVLEKLANWLDIDKSIKVEGGRIELKYCHSAGGSPSRLKTGEIKLQPDIAWRNKLPEKIIKLVSLMTKYCRKTFGY